jgi:peptidoglycan hydrolase-like protein with peptidoglycan-binding domain
VTIRSASNDWARIAEGRATLRSGVVDPAPGGSVHHLQTRLNEWLRSKGQHEIQADGRFGRETSGALKAFQAAEGIASDGIFGKDSFSHLVRAPVVLDPAPTSRHPDEGVARFESTYNTGRTNQGKDGKITVNGRTYQFTAGGQARGHLPAGEYKVEPWRPSGRTQQVDGFGYSYRLLKHQDGRWLDEGIRDPRLGANDRSYFRIHPDGGNKGTYGCIGIRGNRATQQAFKRDMDAAMADAAREGRSYIFTVG